MTFTAGRGKLDTSPVVERIPGSGNHDPRSIIIDSIDLTNGNRLSKELVAWLPKGTHEDWILDLGCGGRNFEEFCSKHTGMRYLGVDFDGQEPHALADAHALPFKDKSFSAIISIAVLEHLALPDVAVREVHRVLEPGGVFVGTVAFLETFHMDSHYHMTHLGVLRVLQDAGFEVKAIAPNIEWTALRAQAEMALFPGIPSIIKRALISPFEALSRVLWKLRGMKFKDAGANASRILETTGGFRFVAMKA